MKSAYVAPIAGVMLAILSLTSRGQTFQTYINSGGTDDGQVVYQTANGDYLLGGMTFGFTGSFDYYLARLNSSGDTLWTKAYGGTAADYLLALGETSTGDLYLMGYSQSWSLGSRQLYIVKTTAQGDTLWTKEYGSTGSDFGIDGIVTDDDGVVMTGSTTGFGASSSAFYVIRVDSLGDLVWSQIYDAPNAEQGLDIDRTSDGGFICAGYTSSYGAGAENSYVVRLDSNGSMLWNKVYGDAGSERAVSVVETLDSGYCVLARTTSGSPGMEFQAIRLNGTGDTLWTRNYGTGLETPTDIVQMPDSGFVIVGHANGLGPGGGFSGVVVRTDKLGDTLWTRIVHDPTLTTKFNSVVLTDDGGFALGGLTSAFGAISQSMFIVKVDAAGNFSCHDYGVPIGMATYPPDTTSGGAFLNNGCQVQGTSSLWGSFFTDQQIICAPPCSAEVHGVVMNGATPVNNGMVQLLQDIPLQLAHDTVQSTSVNASGEFTFTGVDTGLYLVRVIPDDVSYPTAMATYHPQTHRWDSAAVKIVGCNVNDTANIQLVDPGSLVGDGNFSGIISYTNGYRSFGEDRGEPIPGLEVVIERSPSGVVAGSDLTDTAGFYDVGSLSPDDYVIHVDFPGLGHFATYSLTVTPTDTVFTNLDFWINENDAIYTLDPEASIHENLQLNLLVYPNPANTTLNLRTGSDVPLNEIRMFDVAGHVVRQVAQGISTHTVLEISDLKSGIYFLEVRAKDKTVTKKVIIQR